MSKNSVLYNSIGTGYNTTRQADPYIAGRLFTLLSPKTNGLYLDIGCGTGNYTIALANKGLNFTGVEPSEKMLDTARAHNQHISWLPGDAEHIPAENELFDDVIATLTIHHWTDLKKAMREINRVMKPGGNMVLFTALPDQMRNYWLNHYFPVMLEKSILQMPSFEMIKNAAAEAGMMISNTEKYYIQDDLQDLFLYSGKNNPALYLEENVRKGISSFSALANLNEVQEGLAILADDIASGIFDEVKAGYDDTEGDYLFIILQKC